MSAASQAALERLLSLDASAVSDTAGFSKLVRLLFSADELREASKRPGVVEAAALSWLAHHPDRIDGLADEVSEDDRFSDQTSRCSWCLRQAPPTSFPRPGLRLVLWS